MPTPTPIIDGRDVADRRHPEWIEHHKLWQWLYDSWEGGQRYREAIYGIDYRNGFPLYNLIRHKYEYPAKSDTAVYSPRISDLPGELAIARAGDDKFQYRRARTPVPAFVEYAVSAHLSKLYAREVDRDGPDALKAWWKNVDGRGSTIDDWMQDVIAPLLLVLGQIDVQFDHPPKPDGVDIRSKADQDFYGLTDCVASFVLPQNLTWWRIDRMGFYIEAVVREETDEQECRYRYWTATESTLYDNVGAAIGGPIPHRFGRVPIVRLFDRRNPRCKHVGRSRYQTIAQLQQEYYNRDSELILSDSLQAHPLLQGPEDYIKADGTIPIGPNWLLPKKKNSSGAAATYEGFDVVQFPKDGAESIRANKDDILNAVDRDACLTKPAGAAGTNGSTVAQSGLSKRLDQASGNDLLTNVAGRLQTAEIAVARFAGLVLGDGKPLDPTLIEIVYPRSFDLFTPEELSSAIEQIQAIIAKAGALPDTETEMLKRLVRQAVPGLVDEQYDEIDAEIEAAIEAKAQAMADAAKAAAALTANPPAAPGQTPAAAPKQLDTAAQIDNGEAAQGEPSTPM